MAGRIVNLEIPAGGPEGATAFRGGLAFGPSRDAPSAPMG